MGLIYHGSYYFHFHRNAHPAKNSRLHCSVWKNIRILTYTKHIKKDTYFPVVSHACFQEEEKKIIWLNYILIRASWAAWWSFQRLAWYYNIILKIISTNAFILCVIFGAHNLYVVPGHLRATNCTFCQWKFEMSVSSAISTSIISTFSDVF